MRKYFNIKLFIRYISEYWISTLLIAYIIFSIALKSYSGIDITIPCPIYYSTGTECLGCGLTTATSFLFRLDFQSAWHANPLVFIIDLLLSITITRHWVNFVKRQHPTLLNK